MGTGTPIVIEAHLGFGDFYFIHYFLVAFVFALLARGFRFLIGYGGVYFYFLSFLLFKAMRTEFSVLLKLYVLPAVIAIFIIYFITRVNIRLRF
jgi:hypothetical protein